MNVRIELSKLKIEKSGSNKFGGFKYYELDDLIPPIQALCKKYNLITLFSFRADEGILNLLNIDNPLEIIETTTPMPSFEKELNKKMNLVQTVGTYETYQKRYLLINLFDITEKEYQLEEIPMSPADAEDLVNQQYDNLIKYNPENTKELEAKRQKELKDLADNEKAKLNKKSRISGTHKTKKGTADDDAPVFYQKEFQTISEDDYAEKAVDIAKSYLNGISGNAEAKDVRKLIIQHKKELNSIKKGLADATIKAFNGK